MAIGNSQHSPAPSGAGRSEHPQMTHVAMGAVALGTVVVAGLVLLYVSRHAHQHPGATLAVLVGALALIALVFLVARRRRTIR